MSTKLTGYVKGHGIMPVIKSSLTLDAEISVSLALWWRLWGLAVRLPFG